MTGFAGFDYTGRTVLVTGGMRGIGRAISAAFLRAGAQVFVCGRTAPADDSEVPAADGRSAHFIAADIRDLEQADAMLAQIAQASPTLDVVVHNAGGAPFALVADASPRLLESVIRLNLVAPLQLAQRCNARMQQQAGGGTQLFVGSVSALRPSPGTAAYGAAKAGILNAVRTLAVEWAPRVRVAAVSPGMVLTETSQQQHYGDPAALRSMAATVPLGRLALPDDIAAACLFLASPQASYVSGANLVIDGGGERPAFLDAASVNRT
ncbi:SDR family oxidoreductase [Cupriavidus taiwanensis]|uniref:SDR family oxidoreductase n=1 Tax=Cupriavidus taiwanensis TaxID=164546 RepID=UPI000E190E2C|nr:SDR family oxidoreductase [Cupriavidus taiwanensis]SOZ30121.1 putative short-chain dehydrogenase/reductase (SDR family) [Cupriavidus taiwanensis]SPA34820.1 putative short-chain dehydrogenase/reductase (SDR family) [Cupriavidus taiwanensis]SPA52415.1 putative short-chain dehydrogenase/reductase (SDR family) [Cupriavidus taiwanensis]